MAAKTAATTTKAATKTAAPAAASASAGKSENTKVAVPEGGALGQVLDFAADAGAGLEGADKASYAIPFLVVLQPLSPQCAPVEDGGVAGAAAGLLFNTITNELFKTVRVVPVAFQRRYLAWMPRDAGGGFKGEFTVADVEGAENRLRWTAKEGKAGFDIWVMPDGSVLKDTRNHFVLMVREDNTWTPAIVSLASTQIKKSKRWLSRISNIQLKDARGAAFNPPSFSHVYLARSVKEENDMGKWYGIDVDLVGQVADPALYSAAKAFHKQVLEGKVQVSPPPAPGDAEDASGGEQF